MGADGYEGTHGQGRTHVGTPTPAMTGPTESAAVPVQGRQTNQRGEGRAAQGASRWERASARPRTHRADTGHTAQEILTRAPDRPGPPRRITIVVQGCQARSAPRAMGLEIRLKASRRTPKTVLLRRPHGDALPPPGQERPPVLRVCVGHRTRRRTDGRRTVRPRAGSERLSRGQRARGRGDSAPLPWMDHHDGQGRGSQRRNDRTLQTSCGFEHNQGGTDGV